MSDLVKDIIEAFDTIDARRAQGQKVKDKEGVQNTIEVAYAITVEERKESLKNRYENLIKGFGKRTANLAVSYVRWCQSSMLDRLSKNNELPIDINFQKCYSVLQRIEDTSKFLGALEQIFGREEQAIERLAILDLTNSYRDGSMLMLEELQKIENVRVTVPMEKKEEIQKKEVENYLDLLKQSLKEEEAQIDSDIDSLLDDAFDDLAHPEDHIQEIVDDVDKRVKAIEETSEVVEEKLQKMLDKRAEAVVGESLVLVDIEPFDGSVGFENELSLLELAQLHEEVRRSFEVYSQIIRNNGLFSAFPGGVSCSRYFNQYGDRGGILQVPESIEEAPEGDSLSTAVLRMQDFNRLEYDGLFDDNYMQHVDSFWYGFVKLAQFIEEASVLDTVSFDSYMDRIKGSVRIDSFKLGLYMNSYQITEFGKELSRLQNEGDS